MMCNRFDYRPIVYVYSDQLQDFLQFVYPHLEREIVLLAHNGDVTFSNDTLDIGKYPLVYRWILQDNLVREENVSGNTEKKVFSIPIGIANAMFNNGDLSLIESVIDEGIEKEILCLANHSTLTSKEYRSRVDVLILLHPFIVYRNGQHYQSYLRTMAAAEYCLCPRGKGLDTHRIAEALLLGTIPIVKKGEYPVGLSLPVIEVDDWFTITEGYLLTLKKPLVNSDTLQELSLKYWKELLETFR